MNQFLSRSDRIVFLFLRILEMIRSTWPRLFNPCLVNSMRRCGVVCVKCVPKP